MLKAEHPDNDGVLIDRGLAFSVDIEHSNGTKDMVGLLREAGIPTEVFSQ